MRNFVLGMPSLIELDTLESNVELCKELELDFIELNMNLPQFQIDKLNINRLMEIQKNENIFFTFHLPEELDVAHFNSKIRNAYLDIVKETIGASKVLGSPIINMHMSLGVYFTMPDCKIYLYDKYFNEYFDSIQQFQKLIGRLAGTDGVKVAIENTGIYKFNFIIEAVSELLESKNFCLTWDVGHDHSSGNMDRKFILENKSKLRHIHIHDARLKSNHLPLFSGDIDLHEKLKIAVETGSTCVIETKTVSGLKQSVSELRNRFI
jgi:Sugar phosphate isomerases/epimerases